MNPLISIIVPVYNIKKYLNRFLVSIVSQTYKNIEIILINDGSTDGSDEICNEWAKKDSRIKCIHQKNSGVSISRNVGLNQSKGQYIMFLDGDDEVAFEMCEKMLYKIRHEKADLSYCGYLFLSDNINKTYIPNNCAFFSEEEMLSALFLDKSFYCVVWNKLFKRDILYNSDNNPILFPLGIHVGEDQLWLTKVLKNVNKAVSVPEVLYYWNRRIDSATNGSTGATLTKRYLSVLDADVATIKEMPSKKTQNIALKKYLYNIYEILIEAYYSHNTIVQKEMLQRYYSSRKMHNRISLFSMKLSITIWLVKIGAPYSFIKVVRSINRFWRK